ncbi:MAG: hypothetical protein JWO37_3847 [Acidimicrobiales bacterium]|nr:hypothetical protein [Acidimicrobiales bacterium]
MIPQVLAHAVAPARGAPLGDLVPASIVAVLAVLLVAALGFGHRRGVFGALGRFSAAVEDRVGLPGWAAIPAAIGGSSLLCAAFGYYWDVSWHIDRGRDPGPFANPAHWFIIIGLAGIALAGVVAIILGDDQPTGASVRFGAHWHAPVGGVLLAICGVVALAGFPLDDVWHRIFGQDVTAWGPTHIQMIGGASLATLAMWALSVEGRRVAASRGRRMPVAHAWLLDVTLGGAFLMGLSTLQVEFDFGVPQFRQVYHPLLIMLATGIGLVAVRIRAGRGAALAATAFFLAMRVGLAVVIAPVLGRTFMHFPLYVVEAIAVELVAMRWSTRRQLDFGLRSGLAIGTAGLAAEWLWSQFAMPFPWGRAMWPEGAVLGLVGALAGGVIGGMIGRALVADRRLGQPTPRAWAALAWIAAVAAIGWALPVHAAAGTARITTTDVARADGRWAKVGVQLDHPQHAVGANWFVAMSWQGRKNGDGGLVLAPFHRTGPDTWATTDPVPMFGSWKTIIRLHDGRNLEVAPLYLPADAAIPAAGVTTGAEATRPFVRDKTVLQREAVGGSPALQRVAYALLLGVAGTWLTTLGWGLRRLEATTSPAPAPERAGIPHRTAA